MTRLIKVFGYQLVDGVPVRRMIDTQVIGDHGADIVGDDTYRMVPSGDIVSLEERNKRLAAHRKTP